MNRAVLIVTWIATSAFALGATWMGVGWVSDSIGRSASTPLTADEVREAIATSTAAAADAPFVVTDDLISVPDTTTGTNDVDDDTSSASDDTVPTSSPDDSGNQGTSGNGGDDNSGAVDDSDQRDEPEEPDESDND